MTRLLDALERAAMIVGMAAMAALALAVAAFVALRYLFGVSPYWSEEAVRLCLILAVFIGAGLSVRGRQHIRVEFLSQLLPPRFRRWWYLLLDLVALGVFVLIVVTGIEAVQFAAGMKTVALQIPMSTIVWIVPAGFAIAALYTVEEIVKTLRGVP